MLRFINDQFNDKHMSTVQAAFMKKKIRIGNNSVELAIWDTAGQERYHALSPIYYRGDHILLNSFQIYQINFSTLKRNLGGLSQGLKVHEYDYGIIHVLLFKNFDAIL